MNAQQAIEKKTVDLPAGACARPLRSFLPKVDILEREGEYLLLADLPGASAEQLEIHYENGVLTLRASVAPRLSTDAPLWVQEYEVGDFQRSFSVGEAIDTGRILAEYADGVLTLHLPKVEAVKPKMITVRAGS